MFDGKIELDESYFGGVRKGKRGRGAAGKTAVFGLLKCNAKVFMVVVKDTKADTLITSLIMLSYNTLDISDFKHFLINYSKEFTNNHNHIRHKRISGRKPNEY